MNKQFVNSIIYLIKHSNILAQTKPQLYLIHDLLKETSTVDGDIAEVGVFKGGSAKFICNFRGNRKVYLFDTFEGMPQVNENDKIGKGEEGLINQRQILTGEMVGTLEEVQNNLKGYKDVYFYKGIFPFTADPIKNMKFSFVHLDVDIYSSTINALNFFYPRMSDGGIILLHDYAMCTGVKKAIIEFLSNKMERLIVVANQCYIAKNRYLNIPLSKLVLYPFWNDKMHLYCSALEWYSKEIFDNNYNVALREDIIKNGVKENIMVEKLFDGYYGVCDGNHRFYYSLLSGEERLLPCKLITEKEKEIIIDKQIQSIDDRIITNYFYTKPNISILNIKKYYDLTGKSILELGTFEGWDTFTLHYLKPKNIVSIEGRINNLIKANFLKFFYRIDSANMIYANIENLDLVSLGTFDFCLAKGILHYLTNPIKKLRELSKITDNLWIGIRLAIHKLPQEEVECEGYKGKRIYNDVNNNIRGLSNYYIMLYKEELLRLLDNIGYKSITIIREPAIYTESDNYAEIYAKK